MRMVWAEPSNVKVERRMMADVLEKAQIVFCCKQKTVSVTKLHGSVIAQYFGL